VTEQALGQNKAEHDTTVVFDVPVGDFRSAPTTTTIPVPKIVIATAHWRSAHSKPANRQAVAELMAWRT
jgi:hypothetical protein